LTFKISQKLKSPEILKKTAEHPGSAGKGAGHYAGNHRTSKDLKIA
jgi:hypothetical protein